LKSQRTNEHASSLLCYYTSTQAAGLAPVSQQDLYLRKTIKALRIETQFEQEINLGGFKPQRF
jgi:hypothetical protein